MAGIFISYRRSDAEGWAGRLSDSLRTELGRVSIFRDIDDIPPGVEFETYIAEEVGSCDVLIVLIGPSWVNVTLDSGRRRLDDPKDLARIEIATALQRKVRVIPVLVGGAKPPEESALPDDLKPLTRRNAYDLTDSRWADDCRKLAHVLRPLVKKPVTLRRKAVALLLLPVIVIGAYGVKLWVDRTGEHRTPGGDVLSSPSPAPTPSIPLPTRQDQSALPAEPRPPRRGALSLVAPIDGVEIFLDGRRIGEMTAGRPFPVGDLAEGTHVVRAVRAGYRNWQREVNVVAGEVAKIAVELRPLESVPSTSSPTPPEPRLPRAGGTLPQPYIGPWQFTWTAPPQQENVEKYHILIQGATASRPVVDTETTQTNHTVPKRECSYVADMNRLDWTWKVQAKYRNGRWSEWRESKFNVAPLEIGVLCQQCPSIPQCRR